LPHSLTVTFAGSGDAFGSGGRFQACFHVRRPEGAAFLIDCGATSLTALKRLGISPSTIGTVFISHLHGDHYGGLPFLILDGQFSRRRESLTIAGPPGTGKRLAEAMEVFFPGSTSVPRAFTVEVRELTPGGSETIDGIEVRAMEVLHPSGAPPLGLRLKVAGKTIAYTGDTAWSPVIGELSSGADLLIAEAYYREKAIPHHLRLSDLVAHEGDLKAQRVVLTHMSPDVLDNPPPPFEAAHDGYVIHL
jgi:ribonuclease BN (tRNA processing enzyme)